MAEHDKGFCSKPYSRAAMDAMFGPGRWRPLERFQIVQADNKKRMIDNARRTLHNAHTSMQETIFTVNIDFVASVAASLARRLVPVPTDTAVTEEWLRLRLGTDDLPDAYRGLPVLPDHQRFSVIALYVPSVGWRFSLLWGLAFGLESAVVAFNRFPQLGIAISRRCVLSMAAAYFDDELAVEAIADADVSQCGLRLVFSLMGAPPQPEKGFRPTANRHYLGSSIHTGDFLQHGIIRVQPKPWPKFSLDWTISCRPSTCPAMMLANSEEMRHGCLRCVLAIWASLLGPDIPVHPQTSVVTRIYSDASFEDNELRLGWVIFPPSSTPVGGTCVVPPSVVAQWKPRTQQIYPGETLAAVLVPTLCPELLRGCDVLWFFDNEAAVSALIRVTTAETDVLVMVQQAHLQFCSLLMRTWIEWIDSASNPSDGLSRLGLLDEWTLNQHWQVHEFSFPALSDPTSFLAQLAAPIGWRLSLSQRCLRWRSLELQAHI
eukprot:s71_g14.t1